MLTVRTVKLWSHPEQHKPLFRLFGKNLFTVWHEFFIGVQFPGFRILKRVWRQMIHSINGEQLLFAHVVFCRVLGQEIPRSPSLDRVDLKRTLHDITVIVVKKIRHDIP